MNIYKVFPSYYLGRNAYRYTIVVAENEEAARHIHPSDDPEDPVRGYNPKTGRYDKPWYESDCIWDWTKPENVNVTLVGTTDLFPKGTVLCASFNAG